MGREIIEITCPFCNKGKIQIYQQGSVKKYVSGPYGGGKRKVFQSEDRIIVASNCSICGKSDKEIQKKLEEKKEVSHEEKLKRSKKAGMPTVIETTIEKKDDKWDEDD